MSRGAQRSAAYPLGAASQPAVLENQAPQPAHGKVRSLRPASRLVGFVSACKNCVSGARPMGTGLLGSGPRVRPETKPSQIWNDVAGRAYCNEYVRSARLSLNTIASPPGRGAAGIGSHARWQAVKPQMLRGDCSSGFPVVDVEQHFHPRSERSGFLGIISSGWVPLDARQAATDLRSETGQSLVHTCTAASPGPSRSAAARPGGSRRSSSSCTRGPCRGCAASRPTRLAVAACSVATASCAAPTPQHSCQHTARTL